MPMYWPKSHAASERFSTALTIAAIARVGVIWPTARWAPSIQRNLRACESENAA